MTPPDALFVIPFQVGPESYSVMVVLQEHNIGRIREYDPVEVPMQRIADSVSGMKLKDVIVTYATDQEVREVERLARQGEITDALRMLTRGYRYRPDRGDGGPVQHLVPDSTVEYRIRRRQPGEDSRTAAPEHLGKLVTRIRCAACNTTVCVAQTDAWPPTGPVTLHLGRDWPEPLIVGNNVLCGACGGHTVNSA